MPIRVDKTDDIQRVLSNVYLSLFSTIKKDEDYPGNVGLLRSKYRRQVYDSTRKAITQVFDEGHKYVSRALGVETFVSSNDIDLIRDETTKGEAMFWKRLGADAERETQIQAAEGRLIITDKKDELDTQFYLTNAAMIATTGALAVSTLTKTKQIADDPELQSEMKKEKPKIRWVARQDERTCTRLPNGGEGCAFLDNQQWDYDDPEIPVPGRLGPNGTHPNCRCYLSLE